MARALRESKGFVEVAARALGVTGGTVRRAIAKWPRLAAVVAEEREARLDVAELALYAAVQRGQSWAVKFLLKTQGKTRGYVERQEIEHSVQPAPAAGPLVLKFVVHEPLALPPGGPAGDNPEGGVVS